MSQPITPRYAVDTVVLQNISVNFNPQWQGNSWSITPSSVRLFNTGIVCGEGGSGGAEISTDLTLKMNSLPQSVQDAVYQLYDYIEQQMAAAQG